MKKILSLLLCVMIVMSFAACGKKDEGLKNTSGAIQSEDVTKEDNAEGIDKAEDKTDEKAAESNEEDASETQVLPSTTAEELEGMVDEFNTTEDPERKEELRKELEEFLKQAEAMAQ